MSPPALDFGSPSASPQQPKSSSSSSFRNPNPVPQAPSSSPFNFSSINFSVNEPCVSMPGSNSGFATSRTGTGRSRPRLVKVRKQFPSQQGRWRTVSSDVQSGFNPFGSISETSDQTNGSTSTSDKVSDGSKGVNDFTGRSSGFTFLKDDMKFENLDFVFGTKGNDLAYKSKCREPESSGSFLHLSSENGEIKTVTKLECRDGVRGVGIPEDTTRDDAGATQDVKINSSVSNSLNIDQGGENGVFVFGSKSKIASNLKTSLVDELPDDMKKLNIDDVRHVDNTNKMNDPLISSHMSVGTAFVFKAESGPVSSGESTSTTCDNTRNNPNSESSGSKLDKTNKDNIDMNFNVGSTNTNSISTGSSCPKTYNFNTDPDNSDLMQRAQDFVKNITELNETALPLPFSLGQLPDGSAFEVPYTTGTAEKKEDSSFTRTSDEQSNEESSFTSTPCGPEVPFTVFRTPGWDPSCLKASLFPEIEKNLESSVRSKSVKDKRFKKKWGKLRQTSLTEKSARKDHVPRETSDSTDCYSPMDFSPYQETTVEDVEEFPVHPSDQKLKEPNEKNNVNPQAQHSFRDFHVKEYVSGTETGSIFHNSTTEVDGVGKGVGTALPDVRDGFHINTEIRESDGGEQFSFASGLVNTEGKLFSFAASGSAEVSSPTTNHLHRRKSQMKVGHKSSVIRPGSHVKLKSSSVQFSTSASSSAVFNVVQDKKGDSSTSRNKEKNRSEADVQVKQDPICFPEAIQEACEKWRIRGNQAYNNGYFSKAEEFYTWGVNSIPYTETPVSGFKPLVLCYSNRAATRVSLGKIREALGDCMMAASLDPNFLKVQVRAGKCHLLLGEVDSALQYFRKCLEAGPAVCLDRKLAIEASDGLQKAQKVDQCISHSGKLLDERTSDAAVSALDIISEALSICSHSEKLLEMKAEALGLLGKYEDVIQLCEQTLSFAEKNFLSVASSSASEKSEKESFVKLWRLYMKSKSNFYLGRLEVALDLLKKLEEAGPIRMKCARYSLESASSLAVTIRELLHSKSAGNEAFQSKQYAEAVECYTVALSSNVESRPFSAICFCNRAAAHQALGHIADAIADCNLAMALDGNYPKALSRRATLHEVIRDYGQAACDLQRLISILENQSGEQDKLSGMGGKSNGSVKQLRQARQKLSSMEEAAKRGIPLDLYLILGITSSDTEADIKKAYRKAALRHHPDKAGQFLARSESGDEGRIWKEIAREVQSDADRLFKMIGEAYATLSEPTKRLEYDLDEDLRKSRKGSGCGSTYRKSSGADRSPYGSSGSTQRNGYNNNWKTYGNSHSRDGYDYWRTYGNSHSRW